jgi:hypothetical protein
MRTPTTRISIKSFCGGRPFMEPMFHTYQEFYLHAEAITYLMIVAALIGIAWFWNFLSGKDNEKNGNDF